MKVQRSVLCRRVICQRFFVGAVIGMVLLCAKTELAFAAELKTEPNPESQMHFDLALFELPFNIHFGGSFPSQAQTLAITVSLNDLIHMGLHSIWDPWSEDTLELALGMSAHWWLIFFYSLFRPHLDLHGLMKSFIARWRLRTISRVEIHYLHQWVFPWWGQVFL